MNEGSGKDFYRKGNSVKRSGKGPGVQGKKWPKYGNDFLASGLGVVLYLPRK